MVKSRITISTSRWFNEMLKILFASEGWWVNYELPVPIKDKTRGRIDFLIKRSPEDDWRLIEVKLDDNPDAVAQLHEYIKAIRRDVKMNEDSFFWPLHVGRKRMQADKGCGSVRCSRRRHGQRGPKLQGAL